MFLFFLVFAMSLCTSVYMCFVVTCWERAGLLALVCGVYCEFVTFPLVFWVRYGTWLYRFLIFAPLLTFIEFLHKRCAFSMKLAWYAVNTIQWVTAAWNSQDLVFRNIHVIQTLLLNIVISRTLKRTNEFFLLDWCNKLGMVHFIIQGVTGFIF